MRSSESFIPENNDSANLKALKQYTKEEINLLSKDDLKKLVEPILRDRIPLDTYFKAPTILTKNQLNKALQNCGTSISELKTELGISDLKPATEALMNTPAETIEKTLRDAFGNGKNFSNLQVVFGLSYATYSKVIKEKLGDKKLQDIIREFETPNFTQQMVDFFAAKNIIIPKNLTAPILQPVKGSFSLENSNQEPQLTKIFIRNPREIGTESKKIVLDKIRFFNSNLPNDPVSEAESILNQAAKKLDTMSERVEKGNRVGSFLKQKIYHNLNQMFKQETDSYNEEEHSQVVFPSVLNFKI